MERLGMGALLGVARGARSRPSSSSLNTTAPRKKTTRPVVLVGKTITFDTGGISLKPAENMEHMKADMTGGAEVLASIRAAARPNSRCVSSASCRSGKHAWWQGDEAGRYRHDTIGQTVEVQNTDAEGRLILADGLAYANAPISRRP